MKIDPIRNEPGPAGKTVFPTIQPVMSFEPVNISQAAAQEALEPLQAAPMEIRAIHAPKGDRPAHSGVPILLPANAAPGRESIEAPPPSATGPSQGPSKTFKGEFLSGVTIPPDTMGAVGTTHIVNVTNDRMRIQTRDGVEVSRVTLNSFWAGATVKGVAVASTFDPKVYFDRFNNRFILVSSLNGPGVNSGAGVAVTQTSDPTGLWNRFTVVSDPTSTATAGHAIDYPSVGFNKNWIVVNENTFNYTGSGFTSYFGPQIFVFDKQAAYANTLSSVSLFEDPVTNCTAPFESKLGCGFTMAPAITEDNTTDTDYMVEDWDNIGGQLRLTKITGTPSNPVLTVGTQFPQSPLSWQFNAARIGTTGGYAPQRQQSANLTSGTRIMTNDSRIQNAVLRNGTLWTTHTVMLAQTPTPAGTAFGTTNPDTHSAVQWWAINPTIETGLSTTPLQRARIEDPTADNCHNGSAGTRTTGACVSTATQVGQFYAFPNISVNQNNDVLIGFTQFSNLTYPNSAYAMRLAADPPNTTRNPVVFRPGQANYNIGAGAGGTTGRQNRWGDFSAAQTDPLDDTSFWTVQEYAGTVRDFGIGLAGNWETWWAQVKPSTAPPSTNGNLIINEFRLRGPQGVRDEYVELYNPGTVPVIVNTTDNSDGWALAYSANGTTITGVANIPNGTVVPAKGHFLIADNPDGGTGPTLVYGLNGYASTQVRGADSDTGWSFDIVDNGGLAIFKTSNTANFSPATRMDSVGFSSIAAGLFREGAGIPAMTTQPTTNFSFYRSPCLNNAPVYGSALGCAPGSGGLPKDSGANENDFVFVNSAGTSPSAGVQRLGAPGPKNVDGPLERNASFALDSLDPFIAASSSPNRVRNITSDPANNSTFGTISFRRKVTNFTGSTVTRLRFRIIDITTLPAPGGFADLRARTSSVTSATLTGGLGVTVQGTILEEPPTQANGGGFNSTLSAGTVTLATPLLPGASVNLQFLLGVQQTGNFRFFINVEALP